jgi:hypothetical protein
VIDAHEGKVEVQVGDGFVGKPTSRHAAKKAEPDV